ncbi:cysteine-rich DPF motif domain-containing protein 1 isoform X3 [Chiloscyllium plagiosum]|uniref:cysteine-rich DPF motif domain-containing protein 1 isoform X3 n=1 Tax=Chiloscyllium plagiosum TaxID=36176 RepID=UPI001CB817EA|nr:cysteine-rich DPF motif domain-containing protein 1 isoform X3 [Chiloscyllium plagiosum]XP_043565031.1 cysteine-rich DPF motif domain-containing protein 1 isoform X3 [Chiloscyllium plagiosum]XP_043565032.1 cysteine-rich DPF motif domain-containing protein 1 isoform X3 [Chiloscyllium plagiosum]XP_043565033.1 cysteine-rich DPF motif domain-containing protein 1 isoform X3 [Chiloscyllium plagiosum]XP_043565034.1 cysteine-rich DPF motif domain-containing protein 1 isoform X3 [Chiloscyllium plagio
MQSVEDPEPKGMFECSLCRLKAPYSYYGQKPPNARSLVLLEECYTMNDPFTPQRDTFLILGSHCCLCNTVVCVGQEINTTKTGTDGSIYQNYCTAEKVMYRISFQGSWIPEDYECSVRRLKAKIKGFLHTKEYGEKWHWDEFNWNSGEW